VSSPKIGGIWLGLAVLQDCQMRWWFKYGLKVPDPATANMALGRAIHSAIGENFAQKVDTREDLAHRRCNGVISGSLGQRE
jgi:hypothetical protein